MAKPEVTDWDETDSGNTDVSGIGLSDATLIDKLDDIGRAIMGAVKRFFRTNLFRLRDASDQTKLLAFGLGGLTTATTRTLTVQDKDGTVALISDLNSGGVRVATTANITIATALNVGDTLDGVTLAAGDRVFVKDQTSPAQNGVYVAGATPARATDYAAWENFLGASITVAEGTTNAGTTWVSDAPKAGTIDTTSLTFTNRTAPKTAETAAQTVTAGANFTFTHTLGAKPFDVEVWLRFTSIYAGNAVGDEIKISQGAHGDSSDTGVSVRIPSGSTTDVEVAIGLLGMRFVRRDTWSNISIDLTSCQMFLRVSH